MRTKKLVISPPSCGIFAGPLALGKECRLWPNRRRQAFSHCTEPELSLCNVKLFLHCRHPQIVEVCIGALNDTVRIFVSLENITKGLSHSRIAFNLHKLLYISRTPFQVAHIPEERTQ
ncbi:hypothetical protein M0657_011808 [Pyricularia oryzae]|nr:hypothetical protein M0657_011808 [Pyricularia oryzae]